MEMFWILVCGLCVMSNSVVMYCLVLCLECIGVGSNVLIFSGV